MIYVVQPGDTVTSIANAFGVAPDRLRYDNQLLLTDTLVIGQALLVLIPETVHQVQRGDTALSIVRQYGISLRELLQRNPFLAQNLSTRSAFEDIPLNAGQYLVIRYTEQSDEPTILEGYAYPFIRQNILREAMPCLHSLYVFSYGFTLTGQLIEPMNFRFLMNEARLFGAQAILVLTPLTDEGTFNSNLVTVLVNDLSVRQTLIDNLIATAEQEGFSGIDVDFEFILAEDRDAYTSFVAALAEQAHESGLTVSVALPPKTSPDQRGLLYEGVDYGGLGAAADQVLLMTYEWGYTYFHARYRY